MEKALKTISFRRAVKIEHPEGIPLARSFSDYGFAWDGKLLLTYEPPVVSRNATSIAVVGRINGTNDIFSGVLISEFSGDIFSPSQELISSIRSMVQDMSKESGQNDQKVIAEVIEEIIGYAVVNVPVKQIYERIRIDYPTEFRNINIDYRRQNGKTISEDILNLQSRQRLYRFSKLNSIVKTSFLKNEIVTLNHSGLEKLKENNPHLYSAVILQLKNINPINGKYIVFKNSENGETMLVGRDQNSKSGYSRTDIEIPDSILEKYEQDVELEKDSPTYRKEQQKKRYQQQQQRQKQLMGNLMRYFKANNVPSSVFQDIEEARKYGKALNYIHGLMTSKGEEMPAEFDTLIAKIRSGMQVGGEGYLKDRMKEDGIPDSVFQNMETALKYESQLFDIYKNMKQNKEQVPSYFEGLIKHLQEFSGKGKKEEAEDIKQIFSEYGIPFDAFTNIEIAKHYKNKILKLQQHMLSSGMPIPAEMTSLLQKIQ